jgi:hypothetical protein
MTIPNSMWLLVSTCLIAAAVDVELTTLAETRVSGRLVRVSTEDMVLTTGDGEQRFLAKDILAVRSLAPATTEKLAAPTVWIELIDGSRLPASSYTVAGGSAQVTLTGGKLLEVPTRAIGAVRLQDHDSDIARTSQLPRQWAEIRAARAAGDVLVVRKATGDEGGKPTATLDQLEGILGDISEDKVQFTYDEQQIPVDRLKIEGLIYFRPAGRQLPDPICTLEDAAGARWNIKSMELVNDELQLTSVGGVKGQVPLARVLRLDYSTGKIVFLSDWEPLTAQWTNIFGETASAKGLARLYAPRRDQSFSGGPLTVGQRAFSKGLALHSRTLIEYRLDGKYNQFLALAGIDPASRGGGDVRLVVSLDGKSLGEYRITGRDERPLQLELDIRGGRRLAILVDFGAGLDVGDRLHLANARVTK